MRSVSRGQDRSTARGRHSGAHPFGSKSLRASALGLALGLALGPIVPAHAQYTVPGALPAPGPFGLTPGAFTTAPGAYGAPPPTEPVVLPAITPEAATAPLEIPAVPPAWLLTPAFTLGETYTDNVNLAAPGAEMWDFVTTLTPELDLTGQTGRMTVALTYDPQELIFARSSPSNALQQRLLGTGSAIVWPDAVFFDGSHAALGMHPIPSERVAGYRMQPVQSGGHPQAGFVGMGYRHGNQRLPYMFNRRAQPSTGFIDPGKHDGG